MTRTFAALGALVALLAAAPKPQPSTAPNASAKVGAWNLVTDQLHANLATGQFSAPDHVTMTRADGSVIQADRATGNYKAQKASLFGNVSVHDASGTFGLRSAQGTQASSRGPATLTADEILLDDKARLYDAKGKVHYAQGDTNVDAQTAHLNDLTHVIDLAGKVHVVQADRTLDADTATYNTQTGSGTADKNVIVTFQGVTPSIATPKPITIKGPGVP
ncbi:MAG TPA: LptA/OstA family protein [Candidatus Baltobacteraceae bacterium]|nr:LptA/OstA family protein [Candidatus Baltobacteraceae bacterium]